jgi:hypothetical protein
MALRGVYLVDGLSQPHNEVRGTSFRAESLAAMWGPPYKRRRRRNPTTSPCKSNGQFAFWRMRRCALVANRCGHHADGLFGGPRPGQATPLRSVPDGLTGLTGPAGRRISGNYVMAANGIADALDSRTDINCAAGSCGVMIRSQEKRSRRSRRGALRRRPRGRRDEPLRVLVRVLARQAARERFEREVAATRAAPHEVTVQ